MPPLAESSLKNKWWMPRRLERNIVPPDYSGALQGQQEGALNGALDTYEIGTFPGAE